MKNQDLIIFTQNLQQLFGSEGIVKEISSNRYDLGPLYFFIFHNHPDPKLMTVVSYGLSEAGHEKWHAGKPELLLCVESKEESWADSLGVVINELRGKKSFSYGSVYETGGALSKDTKMNSFVIFSCSFLSVDERTFTLPSKTVYLAQAYPIYQGEAKMIQEKGFAHFWGNEAFEDPYWTKRPDVSKLKP